MADPQLSLMSAAQYLDLKAAYLQAQQETRADQRLARAIQGIDRCDGQHPQHVRVWVRAIDGWQAEQPEAHDLHLELAKATSCSDLLDELRRLVSGGLRTWTELRPKIIDHFLSACEEIRLQVQLETARQKNGENPAAYIRRFRTEAPRAYSSARGAPEEDRVIGAFLRGFSDRHFAERLFRKGPLKSLTDAINLAFEMEAQRERMDQTLRAVGQEPMEVNVAEGRNPPLQVTVDKLVMAVTGITQRLTQMDRPQSTPDRKGDGRNRPAASASRFRAPPPARPWTDRPNADQGGRRETRPWMDRPTPGRGGRRETRPGLAGPAYQWTKEGQPICAHCKAIGHKRAECRKRQREAQGVATSGC